MSEHRVEVPGQRRQHPSDLRASPAARTLQLHIHFEVALHGLVVEAGDMNPVRGRVHCGSPAGAVAYHSAADFVALRHFANDISDGEDERPAEGRVERAARLDYEVAVHGCDATVAADARV